MSVSSVHLRFCILLGAQTADYMKIIISNMNLLVIGIRIGCEKDLIIGYRNRLKLFISCIPSINRIVCSFVSLSL